MKKIFYTFGLISFFACTPVKIAVNDAAWTQKEELVVKGRNGFFIQEKLFFGEFKTTKVKRSWTKGSSWSVGIPIADDWVERLQVEFVRRRQTVRFSLADTNGNESEVTAFSKVRWRDLRVGNNPNSIVNVIGDILEIGDAGTNTYAVRIVTASNEQPWEMLIDNNELRKNAKTYSGLLAKSKSEYYIIAPVYKLLNKKGKAVNVPLGGSVGFEFKNPGGETIAAVSMMDNGVVYFSTLSSKEKFLLANAAAALLLQEQLDEKS